MAGFNLWSSLQKKEEYLSSVHSAFLHPLHRHFPYIPAAAMTRHAPSPRSKIETPENNFEFFPVLLRCLDT